MTVQKQAEKQSKSEFAKCKQKAMESTATSFGKGKTHPINPSFAPQETIQHKVYQPDSSKQQNDTDSTIDMWSTVNYSFRYELVQLPDAIKKCYVFAVFFPIFI